MAETTFEPNRPSHARSISMPSEDHPVVLRIEEQMQKLRLAASASGSTIDVMSDLLKELGVLSKSIEELLHLQCSKQAFSEKKWLQNECDESIRLLDLCETVKDSLTEMKEHIQGLQLALRKRDPANIERKVHSYICFQKKMDKNLNTYFRSMKQVDRKGSNINEFATMRCLSETKMMTLSVMQLLSSFLVIQIGKQKSSRWSFVAKTFNKRKVASEEFNNEYENINLNSILFKDVDDNTVQIVLKQLQSLEVAIEGVEDGLQCLFRQLIQTRVSILNILSS